MTNLYVHVYLSANARHNVLNNPDFSLVQKEFEIFHLRRI